jgi:phage protein D
MPNEQNIRSLAEFQVLIDGTAVGAQDEQEIHSWRVDTVTNGPDFFEVVFPVRGAEGIEVDVAAKIGSEVEIKAGYEGTLETIVKGEIAAIGMRLSEDETPRLTVSGWDKLHRLARMRLTQHWEQVKYSEVAEDIASKAGLSPDVTASSAVFDYVAMNGQTYLAFLLDLGSRIGYQLHFKEGKMYFGPPGNESSGVTVEYGVNLQRASFQIQSAGQVSEVRVLSFDKDKKEQVIGVAAASDAQALAGGKTGPKATYGKFGSGPHWVTNYPGATQAEVDSVAKAIMQEHADDFVHCELQIEGDGRVVAGKKFEVAGVHEAFNGPFVATRVVHQYVVAGGAKAGFISRITGQRSDTKVFV